MIFWPLLVTKHLDWVIKGGEKPCHKLAHLKLANLSKSEKF